MKRLAKSEVLRQGINELLFSGAAGNVGHPLDAFVRLGARYLLQVALEQEITEFLGRAHYKRGNRLRTGYRNGYEPKDLKSSEGILQVMVPQLRQTEEEFESKLLEQLGKNTDSLSKMIKEMYVRGLSTRDIESLFLDIFSRRVISRSGVSKVTEQLSEDFDKWRNRDLSDLKIVYLFLDGIYLALRQGTEEKEGVLCAYGITEEGKKVLIHLAVGSRESYDSWLCFLHDLKERGLREPLLVIHDGNPGLKRAIREVYKYALRQRCQAHKMRNILSKIPKKEIEEIKPLIQKVFKAESYEKGIKRGKALISRFKDIYTSAMECLEKDLEETLTYLKFPKEHHKKIRTTNLLERTFGEGRRRTKVVGRFPTEKSTLKLVFATLIRASQSWYGIKMTPKILNQLNEMRREIFRLQEIKQEEVLAV